ncbi:MAG: cell surface protein, partial [Gammaproteobacteria bacterium]
MNSPMKLLDKALNQLRDLGLVPNRTEEAPIIALLNRISDLDEERVVAIARTLSQTSLFNEVVREQISAMKIGERYEEIADAFESIRKDAKNMVEQFEDGDIDAWERLHNVWVKVTRGDIAHRFDKIKRVYLDVAEDTRDQIERERVILTAYQDFRGALKEAEVLAFEVLKTAESHVERAKVGLRSAVSAVDEYTGEDPAERARLELARDQQLRVVQEADERYQISKDLSDNLTVGYNTTEVVMARLMQTTNAKDRVYKQAVAFFGTNETVLTALSASFTGLHGLHESTETVNTMKEGVSRSLEDLADIGGKVQEA